MKKRLQRLPYCSRSPRDDGAVLEDFRNESSRHTHLPVTRSKTCKPALMRRSPWRMLCSSMLLTIRCPRRRLCAREALRRQCLKHRSRLIGSNRVDLIGLLLLLHLVHRVHQHGSPKRHSLRPPVSITPTSVCWSAPSASRPSTLPIESPALLERSCPRSSQKPSAHTRFEPCLLNIRRPSSTIVAWLAFGGEPPSPNDG